METVDQDGRGHAGGAIVTGSESGIGRATAVALARAGHDVGITWLRDAGAAAATARELEALGRRAPVRRLDLADRAGIAEVVGGLADCLGSLRVFVNNAGIGIAAPFLELSAEDWDSVLAVNLTGAFLAAQEAARLMVAAGRGGRIVNVTSVHAHLPSRGSAAYCVSKAGLGMLTKAMALDLAEHAITVNSVAPGEIATAMTGAQDSDPQAISRPAIPVGRPGDAREVAAAIAFLASPEAAYVTGTSLVADGGLTLIAAVPDPG